MSAWFEACDSCEQPDMCFAVLNTVIGEERGMRVLVGAEGDSFDGRPQEESLRQAGTLVTQSAQEAEALLRRSGCGHDGLSIQKMIVEGIAGGGN
ncbi:MAG TPA: hypothetical protein VMR34_03415 [Candidatus Saccharimonadales bacterium]|nr:hypothetical protein [Candidatus Saccharimonadales bacterium]